MNTIQIEQSATAYYNKIANEPALDTIQQIAEKAFKAGIKWFFEQTWHDMSEEPTNGKFYIMFGKHQPKVVVAFGDTNYKKEDFKCWAYVVDLIPFDKVNQIDTKHKDK